MKLFSVSHYLGFWECCFTDSFMVTQVSYLVGGLNTAVQNSYIMLSLFIRRWICEMGNKAEQSLENGNSIFFFTSDL